MAHNMAADHARQLQRSRQVFAHQYGDETVVLGDAGYQGVEKREENQDTKVTWHVAMKRSKRKALPANRLGMSWQTCRQSRARCPFGRPMHCHVMIGCQA
jgi:IS5 family transposase